MKTELDKIYQRSPGESEFHQAVQEVYESVKVVLDKEPKYNEHNIFERIAEPERIISFKVTWENDKGEIQINRGYRVQMNSSIGPFKGGLRFHPSVNQSILKFLGYEQTFKNALTGIPLGGGKGGSDFDPKGKSDSEVMRFCQAFMTELSRHIGHRTDIPAGDIGVGSREIGYLYGAYKKMKNEFIGILTGKGVNWGGSLIRTEATGYGVVYFASYMMEEKNDSLKDKVCVISGAGNVAQYAVEKLLHMGAKPVSVSDSSGFIYDKDGINEEKLEFIKELKNIKRGRLKEYAEKYNVEYVTREKGQKENPLWKIKADCFFPCATQNEINKKDAENIVANGAMLLVEGANMPCSSEAIKVLIDGEINYAPGKASNAGGVATSGLEMIQNYTGENWSAKKVDEELQAIMKNIHENCLKAAEKYGMKGNYQVGANIAGFEKVADSMIDQGLV